MKNLINKRERMVILIDMDNVVADLLTKWLAVYNEKYDDALIVSDIHDFEFSKNNLKCTAKEFFDIINIEHIFADLDVIPGAIESTKNLLKAGHTLYFVTATPFDNKTAGYDKFKWVERHFPHIGRNKVIQTHDKNIINGDVLFDDSPHNLEKFSKISIAMNYNFNKNTKCSYRVSTWHEFEKTIDKIQ